MSKPIQTPYTADELRQALKDRQAGLTLQQFAAEVGISVQYASQILNGVRPISNDRVLEYLAPKGYRYVKQEVYYLVER